MEKAPTLTDEQLQSRLWNLCYLAWGNAHLDWPKMTAHEWSQMGDVLRDVALRFDDLLSRQ